MDPGRRAMLEGSRSPSKRDGTKRDVTAPRHDPNTRISKPAKSDRPKPANNSNSKYMTQDEQERQFIADEDKFVLKQSKKKADIRVREGRAKPIDFLAFNLKYIDSERDVFDDDEGDLDIEIPSPDTVVQKLNEGQLTELENEISSYHVLESNAKNREYWDALKSLCSVQKAKLRPARNEERVVSSVADDIDKILAPKTYEQLAALEGQIKAKLRSSEDIDTDYWEQLLRSLAVWKAKAILGKLYKEIADNRQERLKERGPSKASTTTAPRPTETKEVDMSNGETSASLQTNTQGLTTVAETSQPPLGTGRFSQAENTDHSQATDALYAREVARGVSENEEVFAAEETVTNASKPQWADKYRARKPRYFNRVQMGYEWNKYNQTHYDHDNPPPKVVQGYKFNIFYPELIDKTKAPTFKIIREHGRRRGESFAAAGEDDTCLIRFIAGPPYEDIAFRIVDREWDYSAKRERGFRSSFDKGILQLHFQFKKIFYRK